ncbi:MAG: tyrosine-type recombinase/integrase [Gammaproteobacteria bacterium]|nr:tyrosine-type recombinase/integrase [Gammaproteobacteria bacterium]
MLAKEPRGSRRAKTGNAFEFDVQSIAMLPVSVKPYRVWDTHRDANGLYCHVFPSGTKVYKWYYRHPRDGRPRHFNVGRATALTPARARAHIRENLLPLLQEGVDPADQKRAEAKVRRHAKASSVEAFLNEIYLPLAGRRKSGAHDIARIRREFDFLMQLDVADAEAARIRLREYIRRYTGSTHTLHRNLNAISAFYSCVVDDERIEPASHPVRGLRRPALPTNERVRYLSVDEESALRNALRDREEQLARAMENGPGMTPDPLRTIVLLGINTGMRRSEVLNLQWQDIDLSERMATIAAAGTRTNRTRRVPLNSEAVEILRAWRERSKNTGKYVFPGNGDKPIADFKKAWHEVMQTADIKGFRYSDLRHHAASMIVQAGNSLHAVGVVLGHTNLRTTRRYAYLAPEKLLDVVESVKRKPGL